MCMLRLPYLMAIVPIAALLTASFFVLFTLRKIEEKWLKGFGYVVLVFLWLAALVVFTGAIYNFGRANAVTNGMMPSQKEMDCMPQMMHKGRPQSMTMSEKSPMVKDTKDPGTTKCVGNKGVVFKAE
jgi:hypothetical protein